MGVRDAAAVRDSAGCTKLELRIGPNWTDAHRGSSIAGERPRGDRSGHCAAAPFLDAWELRSGFMARIRPAGVAPGE